ncbi:hypothetical protein DFH09DRAFT_1330464 [Mycena vulgaris]|nr:hypothetical protein DFH09DRAFT_1330464 [Mycena vulgaris]
MFILITMRCVIATYRCVVAINNPDVDFGPPNSTLGNLANVCWILVTTVADAFIIFRTFTVWNSRWTIILIPVGLCIANFGMGVWVMVAIIRSVTRNAAVWGGIVQGAVKTYISLTLCTNVVCTSLIAFRIIQVQSQIAGIVSRTSDVVGTARRSVSMKVLSIISESAAVYTVLLVGTLVSAHLDSFVVFVLLDCTPPIIGLVFAYIIIAVSRGTSYGESTAAATRTASSFRADRRGQQTDDSFELDHSVETRSPGTKNEIQVRLEEGTHVHGDLGTGPKY